MRTKRFAKVRPIQDGDGHWYIVPEHVASKFIEDLESMEDEKFFDKYNRYMIGGDLNQVVLYAEIITSDKSLPISLN